MGTGRIALHRVAAEALAEAPGPEGLAGLGAVRRPGPGAGRCMRPVISKLGSCHLNEMQ